MSSISTQLDFRQVRAGAKFQVMLSGLGVQSHAAPSTTGSIASFSQATTLVPSLTPQPSHYPEIEGWRANIGFEAAQLPGPISTGSLIAPIQTNTSIYQHYQILTYLQVPAYQVPQHYMPQPQPFVELQRQAVARSPTVYTQTPPPIGMQPQVWLQVPAPYHQSPPPALTIMPQHFPVQPGGLIQQAYQPPTYFMVGDGFVLLTPQTPTTYTTSLFPTSTSEAREVESNQW